MLRCGNFLFKLSCIFINYKGEEYMNISLNEIKDVSELAAEEIEPVRGRGKYAQRSDVQVYQDELDMNDSLEV